MKKIKIEGDLKIEIEKQFKSINAIHSEIRSLSESKYDMEMKMWNHLKKEFPDQSENCALTIDGEDLIFTDRLKD